jgi:hypothetical protein
LARTFTAGTYLTHLLLVTHRLTPTIAALVLESLRGEVTLGDVGLVVVIVESDRPEEATKERPQVEQMKIPNGGRVALNQDDSDKMLQEVQRMIHQSGDESLLQIVHNQPPVPPMKHQNGVAGSPLDPKDLLQYHDQLQMMHLNGGEENLSSLKGMILNGERTVDHRVRLTKPPNGAARSH